VNLTRRPEIGKGMSKTSNSPTVDVKSKWGEKERKEVQRKLITKERGGGKGGRRKRKTASKTKAKVKTTSSAARPAGKSSEKHFLVIMRGYISNSQGFLTNQAPRR